MAYSIWLNIWSLCVYLILFPYTLLSLNTHLHFLSTRIFSHIGVVQLSHSGNSTLTEYHFLTDCHQIALTVLHVAMFPLEYTWLSCLFRFLYSATLPVFHDLDIFEKHQPLILYSPLSVGLPVPTTHWGYVVRAGTRSGDGCFEGQGTDLSHYCDVIFARSVKGVKCLPDSPQ